MTNAIREYYAKQFLRDAQAYADEHGWEVDETLYGVEFYDADGREVDNWDFAVPGEEERVRY
jgi:hypothetical protein